MASQIKCCTFSSSPNRGGESSDHDAPPQSSCFWWSRFLGGTDNFDLWPDFVKYWESLINRFYVVLPAPLLEGLQGPQQRTCWEGTMATCHSCKNQRRLAVMTCMRVGGGLDHGEHATTQRQLQQRRTTTNLNDKRIGRSRQRCIKII